MPRLLGVRRGQDRRIGDRCVRRLPRPQGGQGSLVALRRLGFQVALPVRDGMRRPNLTPFLALPLDPRDPVLLALLGDVAESVPAQRPLETTGRSPGASAADTRRPARGIGPVLGGQLAVSGVARPDRRVALALEGVVKVAARCRLLDIGIAAPPPRLAGPAPRMGRACPPSPSGTSRGPRPTP